MSKYIKKQKNDLTVHLANCFDLRDEIIFEGNTIGTILRLYDDGYEAFADRTSLYEDVGMSFDTLLYDTYDTDYTLSVYASFYPNGDVRVALTAESDVQDCFSYEVSLLPDETELLKSELNKALALQNQSLHILFAQLETDTDIKEKKIWKR